MRINLFTIIMFLVTVFIVYMSVSETRCPMCHKWFAVYAADKKPRAFVYKCRKCDYQWTQQSRKLTPLGFIFEGIEYLFGGRRMGFHLTTKSFRQLPSTWLVLTQGAAIIFLRPWLGLVASVIRNDLLGEAFTQGLSTAGILILIMLFYPIWAICLAVGSWIFYRSHDNAAAMVMSSIPITGAFLMTAVLSSL